jgi:signal peptidase I
MNAENEEQNPLVTEIIAPKHSALKAILKEIGIFALIAVFIVLPFRMFIAEPYIVDGISMDPTFHTGDYLIVDKLSYEIGVPKRNSVLVMKFPLDPSKKFIKRVIGLPGDTVSMKKNVVTIINKENPKGFLLDQSYLVNFCTTEAVGRFSCKPDAEIILKDGEYFVMGDNRAESYDSRYWGVLPKADIIGKPVLQLWPLTQIGFVPGQDSK